MLKPDVLLRKILNGAYKEANKRKHVIITPGMFYLLLWVKKRYAR